MFKLLFERNADPIWLLDPKELVLVDCNQAAVDLFRARDKQHLVGTPLDALSTRQEPEGQNDHGGARTLAVLAEQNGTHRFEWLGRRFDGTEVPLEVMVTAIVSQGRPLHVVVSRDVTVRKEAEREIRELNQTLELRILERTAELTASEAQLRTLLEHAPEAIVVFGGDARRFVTCNENALRFYGFSREQLLRLTPAQVSPEFQPDGRPSSVAAEEKIRETLAGGAPTFEWVHCHSSGRLLPCEIRLVRLPGEGELVRASIIDNTERKRRDKIQQATYSISEAVHIVEDLAGLYRQIHSIISGLMPAQNFYIALLDVETQMISFPYHVDQREPCPPPRPMNTGLTSLVLRSGKPLLVGPNLEASKKRVGAAVTLEGLEGASYPYLESGAPAAVWLGVPLVVRGKTLGVVAVQDYESPQAYGEEEKQILTFVAGQIALAIERKRAEQDTRDSEAKFRALFEASSQGVILHDEHQMLEVNPACLRILGFSSADEMIGKHPAETSAPFQLNGESAEVLSRKYIQECMTRGYARFDWLARNSRGEEIPIEIVLTRIDWSGRQLMQAVFNDISERKRAEAELRASEARLRESEARFSAAFEASPVFITISRFSDGRYVLANDAFLKWTGYSREEVLNKTSAELALWANPAERDRFWDELRRTGSIHERECLARGRHGSVATMLLSCDIILVDNQPHLLTVGLDISQRKQAEAELLKTLAREKELGQLKSNFVSMVSHEFRTPLGIIQSSAEILRDYFPRLTAAERDEQLASVVRNTRRMAEMMEEILVLSRLDAGKMEFKPATLDWADFCRGVVNEVLSATERRCSIELSLDDCPTHAEADERLLGHIFTNLLTNAVKYSEPGTPVRFQVHRDGPRALCRIEDRGIGIPAQDIQWLFTAFHRGANVADRPGTGLGLVLVKRCADLHGGKLQVDSQLGQGTTVTVTLPVFRTPL